MVSNFMPILFGPPDVIQIQDMLRNIGPIFILILLFTAEMLAQDSLAIWQWQSHLPYTTGNYVSQSPDKIIYSTRWSLFTIDKEDFSIEFMDKVNLLTDVGIYKHKYDRQGSQLIVIYDDSSLDIIRGMEVYKIPDISQNTSILGDKQIYNIHINDDRTAYLSCGFGIVEFKLDNFEFGFTCFTDLPVYQTVPFGQYIFAATADGLYYIDREEHLNLADFGNWNHAGQELSLPAIYEARDMVVWNDHLYACDDGRLWKSGKDLSFDLIYQTGGDSEISFLNKNLGEVILGVSWVYDVSKVLYFKEDDSYVQGHHECANRINFAELDETGRIWYADKIGDIRYANNKLYPCESVRINSPYSANVTDVETLNDQVFIASGGVDPSYTYIYRRDGYYIWDGNQWKNYNEKTFPVFQEKELYDCFRILPHPVNDKVFIGTYHNGLIEMDLTDESMYFFDQENSTLAGKTGDETRERISGLAFDQEQNLWISNFGAPRPISVYTHEGTWLSFDVKSGKDLRDVAIDRYGYKWFIIDREAEGILIYDEGEDLEDPSDDRQRIITKDNSELESNKVNAIEVDLDGDVWVGTSEGPVVFECGAEVFSSNCRGNRRKTVLEGIPAYLLDEVNINCIETDGANRKWFGSENGIFVQSPSGEDQIHHFTKENSPLFDNSVLDLAYNAQNGTMFIATAKGVLSYRTETTQGAEKHRGDVYAFPNPVRPDYTGPIAIRGFARDSNVKITDIKGQLIHETTALGGQAIWNGYDYSGRRAASGVYLVWASSTDTFDEPDAMVTRILVIRGN